MRNVQEHKCQKVYAPRKSLGCNLFFFLGNVTQISDNGRHSVEKHQCISIFKLKMYPILYTVFTLHWHFLITCTKFRLFISTGKPLCA